MIIRFPFRPYHSFVFVLVFVSLIVFWRDLVIFLLIISFFSFVVNVFGEPPVVGGIPWNNYCWQPHKFCKILCFVQRVLWVLKYGLCCAGIWFVLL